MTGVTIVAIPSEDDYVWRVSSEKVPHMTMLFLGDITPGPALARIESFVEHVVDTTMCRFGMSVERRGLLGPEDADVLFFRQDYSRMAATARTNMLLNPDIKQAYNSVDQYPEWTPHLTLGYPATPAKKDLRDFTAFHWVDFDKISLWIGDSEGPEFLLKDREEAALTMSDTSSDILEHHGVKGMKWGVRKAERNSSEVTIRTNPAKNNRVRVTGGKGHHIHEDAVSSITSRQKAKSSGVHTLSNAELKKLVERMNLEQQYSRMSGKTKGEGRKFAEEQLKSVGRQKIATVIAKKAVKTAAVASALA